MSTDDFWYNYEYLFGVYMKSYTERVDRECWLQGVYFAKALESTIISYMPLAVAQGVGLSDAEYKPLPYPETPLCTTKTLVEEQKELTEDDQKNRELSMMDHWI